MKLLPLQIYYSLKTGRCDRPGGGIIINVPESLPRKRWTDLELQDIEAIWIETKVRAKKQNKNK